MSNKKTLSRVQRGDLYQIMKMIEAAGTKGEDGFFKYHEGQDDNTIKRAVAADLGVTLPLSVIQAIRIDMKFPLRPIISSRSKPESPDTARVVALEQRVAVLQDALQKLIASHNRLLRLALPGSETQPSLFPGNGLPKAPK